MPNVACLTTMAAVRAVLPIYGGGELIVCPACYPVLWHADQQIHSGHYRRGFPNTEHAIIVEDGQPIPSVEEAFELPNVPGLLLIEFVTEPDGQYVSCRRNGHAELMRRIRYAPLARVTFNRKQIAS